MSLAVLYISYDGMLEPLGQSQVLAYLERLAPDRRIHLVSFEKPRDRSDREKVTAMRRRIADAGIEWHPLRYHKSPSAPATAYDLAAGTLLGLRLARRHRVAVVHARSYVAGVMALAVKRATGARFLFDIRGFWADERVEGGLWPAGGRLYRAAKRVERSLFRGADHVVTLTHASEREIAGFDYLQGRAPATTVIPTCADLARFRIQGPLQQDPFVLGYIGSVGTWYLLDEMLRCFLLLREQAPGARLLIANRGEHERIAAKAAAHGIGGDELELVSASHDEVPQLIGRMSAALALYKPGYSRLACAPTKVAEYLACGAPCVGSAWVGDLADVLEGGRVGVAIHSCADAELRRAMTELLTLVGEPNIQARCRAVAEKRFSLAAGVRSYAAIYETLAG